VPTYRIKPAWMRRRPDNWPGPLPPEYRPPAPAPAVPPAPCRCPACVPVREQVERVRRERVTP
jgi:hypothetical protein